MASQSNFSNSQYAQSSPEFFFSGYEFLQGNQEHIGGQTMNRNLSLNSTRSTNTTESLDSQMTFASTADSTYDWDMVPNCIPNIKVETMAYDNAFNNGYEDQLNEPSRPSPRTEQADSFTHLSLGQPTTEQADFYMIGQQFRPQSFCSASSEKVNPYPADNWSQPSSQTSGHINTGYTQGFQGSINPHSYLGEQPEERHTPNSLGWACNSDLLKKYQLIIRKGKEPFLQLESQSHVTADTPAKVYFDRPLSARKGEYFCLWPGDCDRKRKPFGRPADMDRHLKNVHADLSQKDRFPCDYEKCSSGRHFEPFTRKDHYRDHLRDFHKEDIGAVKGEKSAKTEKEKANWKKEQKSWLAERRIYADSWRCAKCLAKKLVREEGWECYTCKTFCEQERIDARKRLPQKAVSQAVYADTQAQYQSYTGTCEACSGSMWVDNGYGNWVPCITCGG